MVAFSETGFKLDLIHTTSLWPLILFVRNILQPILPFFVSDLVSLVILHVHRLHVSLNFPNHESVSWIWFRIISFSLDLSFFYLFQLRKLISCRLEIVNVSNHLLQESERPNRVQRLGQIIRCSLNILSLPKLIVFIQ